MENCKIDFVVTWVDGADPLWLKEKAAWKPSGDADGAPERYRDWDLMRFWFRGVAKFAPWVNRIHFVTWGHVPEWLNTQAPKLHIVRHGDYMPADVLPSFNSNAIEMSMHRIDGLAEHFVYFNDDMFLLKNVRPEDFFRNGRPVDSAVMSPVMPVWKEEIGKTVLNNVYLINKHFDKKTVMKQHPGVFFSAGYGSGLLRTLCLLPWRHFPGFFNDHLPIPYLRSTFEEVWELEGERLAEVLRHRFRDYSGDVSHWLMRYWQFCKGVTHPASRRRGKDLRIDEEKTVQDIRDQRYKMICINDSAELADDFENVRRRIRDAFSFLSDRCEFELPDSAE